MLWHGERSEKQSGSLSLQDCNKTGKAESPQSQSQSYREERERGRAEEAVKAVIALWG